MKKMDITSQTKIPDRKRNEPRFLDYRRSPLPLDIALSFLTFDTNENATSPRQLVLSGKVCVNGSIETSCHRLVCRRQDKIAVQGIELERPIPMPRYFICYKARGVVCSNRRNEAIDRADAVYISNWLSRSFESRHNSCSSLDQTNMKSINTVGRLDEESEGLLLLTNDGSFARLLCDPEFGLSKTYRVVAKGSGFCSLSDDLSNFEPFPSDKAFAKRITERIKRGNTPSGLFSGVDGCKPQLPYERCTVLDVGKLPSQHPADDSFYALVDLTLREGKTHAVRRIIKNSGLRVCYLSRIQVEGLDCFAAVKPCTLEEAETCGFLRTVIDSRSCTKDSAFRKYEEDASMFLEPGDVVELRPWHVDRVFSLRHSYSLKWT